MLEKELDCKKNMDLLIAAFLGVVQGFTEWLPISSSGHLVIAKYVLGVSQNAQFDIALMVGTIAALILYFRKKIWNLALGTLKFEKESMQFLKLLVLAGIPTALIGFSGKTFFESLFTQPFVVSVLIFVTGIFLFIASKAKQTHENVNEKDALLVGVAQGIAVAPGISRSGSTIGTALLRGVNAQQAAEFSFLIGIPAMIIATLFELQGASESVGITAMAIGILTAFLAGYASIAFFMRMLKQGKIVWFAYYCLGAGMVFAFLTH